MLPRIAIAAIFALALPGLAAAQPHEEHKAVPPHGGPPHGGPPPGPHRGPPPGPHGPVGAGPRGAQFIYHGRPFNRVHVAPFVYPAGWGYRRWAVGGILPPLFLGQAYWYADWAALGLAPPQPGFQWVRYGPDLLLVNLSTGQVVDVIYGAFY